MPRREDEPRVLVVAPLYHTERGGLGRQAVLLTERLAELGARPVVATRRMLGLPERRFSPLVPILPVDAGRPDVHNYERPDLTNLLTSLRFSAGVLGLMALNRRRFDVVHVHGASLPFLLVIPGAKLLGKRVIGKVAALHQGVEAGDLRYHYGPLGRLLSWLANRSDAFIATTDEIGQALADEGTPWERIVRIPNFVDVARFHPVDDRARERLRSELGWTQRTVVLHSGRLTPRKAGDVLLPAFLDAARAVDDARPLLVFLGDGPERERLEALAAEHEAGDLVRFVGFHTDVERWLQAADVLALSSRVEGLPNALLEGMACGLPVVATDLGGAREAVVPDQTGLIVPPDDPGALRRALQRLLGDPELRRSLGAASARRITERFTLEAIAPRYLELYRRLLRREVPHEASVFRRALG